MISDKVKQQARLSILERLKQKMPGILNPVPTPEEEIPEALEGEEKAETLNDMTLDTSGIPPIPLKKKRPVRP